MLDTWSRGEGMATACPLRGPRRVVGVRRCACVGDRVWAGYGPSLDMGQKAKSKPT
jgi:hypothetical protein